MTTEGQNPQDAPKQGEQNPTTPSTNQPEPKVEIKDGQVLVDGKKYVKESDLIAAKESLQGQLTEAQQVHNEAVDKLKLEVSEAQKSVAQANAELEQAKQARQSGDISAEDLSAAREEAKQAKEALEKASTDALSYRRQYIMNLYNIPPDSETAQKLAEKNASQLDAFEEALKAVTVSRGGPGNYVLGGGGGGAAPKTDLDRAKDLLASTPYRGVRNAPNQPPQ